MSGLLLFVLGHAFSFADNAHLFSQAAWYIVIDRDLAQRTVEATGLFILYFLNNDDVD